MGAETSWSGEWEPGPTPEWPVVVGAELAGAVGAGGVMTESDAGTPPAGDSVTAAKVSVSESIAGGGGRSPPGAEARGGAPGGVSGTVASRSGEARSALITGSSGLTAGASDAVGEGAGTICGAEEALPGAGLLD